MLFGPWVTAKMRSGSGFAKQESSIWCYSSLLETRTVICTAECREYRDILVVGACWLSYVKHCCWHSAVNSVSFYEEQRPRLLNNMVKVGIWPKNKVRNNWIPETMTLYKTSERLSRTVDAVSNCQTGARVFFRCVRNLRKATISSVMPKRRFVCLSVRTEQLGSHWTNFDETWYLNRFRKSAEKIQVLLKSDKNNGYFSARRFHIYDNNR